MGNRDQSYCSACDSYYFIDDGCNCVDRDDYKLLELKVAELEAKLALAYDSCQKHASVVDKLMAMRPNLVGPVIKEVWGE